MWDLRFSATVFSNLLIAYSILRCTKIAEANVLCLSGDGAIMARWRAQTSPDVTDFDGCGTK